MSNISLFKVGHTVKVNNRNLYSHGLMGKIVDIYVGMFGDNYAKIEFADDEYEKVLLSNLVPVSKKKRAYNV